MHLAGLTLHNPRTGVVARLLDADEQVGGRFTLEYTVPRAEGPFIDAHLHQHWTEHFEVLAGTACYRLGRADGTLTAGESVTLGPGIPHVHPWNVGAEPLRVRQTSTLHRPDPEAIRDTFRAFAMLSWLTREGKVDARGKPHPLQGALILRGLQRHGGYLAGIPVPVQRVLVGALAALGERRGYVAFDPRCIPG